MAAAMPHIYVENGKWEWYNQKKVNFSVLRNKAIIRIKAIICIIDKMKL